MKLVLYTKVIVEHFAYYAYLWKTAHKHVDYAPSAHNLETLGITGYHVKYFKYNIKSEQGQQYIAYVFIKSVIYGVLSIIRDSSLIQGGGGE